MTSALKHAVDQANAELGPKATALALINRAMEIAAATPTDRQLEALRFIAQHQKRHGYAPTVRELGEHMKIRSTNGVNDHIKALAERGLVTKSEGKARTLAITKAGQKWLPRGRR